MNLDKFRQIWMIDFEFIARDGNRPIPVCMVAREFRTGKVLRLWQEELRSRLTPPFPTDEDALFVAYFSSAEFGCHLSLHWPLPIHVLDLYVEFRVLTNGLALPAGNGLIGALSYFELDHVESTKKDAMRTLVLRAGEHSVEERSSILSYCESDVHALGALFDAMATRIDWPRALLRGQFMKVAAQMEFAGVPIDTQTLCELRESWPNIERSLIEEIDAWYGVFENGSFRGKRWAEFLHREGIPWPTLPSGALALDEDTFKERSLAFPKVAPMRELRKTLTQMRRLEDLAVGIDGRNRCLLSPFSSKTGRNQPSNSRFIFGRPKWLRGLIQPEPGRALAYLDYEQQEFGIAAALSADHSMQDAYSSGDPYIAFARKVGAIPPWGSKETHSVVRDQFKACVLAVQYGMGPQALASQINVPLARARELLDLHRQTFRRFWGWSGGAVHCALLSGRLWTAFGWPLLFTKEVSERTLRNFPMQANGAEMLRIACCQIANTGIALCAPVHDAILIESSSQDLLYSVDIARDCMELASEAVLGGFRLRIEAKLIHYPNRFLDDRTAAMWGRVQHLLGRQQTRLKSGAISPDSALSGRPTSVPSTTEII